MKKKLFLTSLGLFATAGILLTSCVKTPEYAKESVKVSSYSKETTKEIFNEALDDFKARKDAENGYTITGYSDSDTEKVEYGITSTSSSVVKNVSKYSPYERTYNLYAQSSTLKEDNKSIESTSVVENQNQKEADGSISEINITSGIYNSYTTENEKYSYIELTLNSSNKTVSGKTLDYISGDDSLSKYYKDDNVYTAVTESDDKAAPSVITNEDGTESTKTVKYEIIFQFYTKENTIYSVYNYSKTTEITTIVNKTSYKTTTSTTENQYCKIELGDPEIDLIEISKLKNGDILFA